MDAEKKLGEEPHGGMFLVLAYLPLVELLAMSQICKSMREALNKDIWPWLKTIIIQEPLNSKLSDDSLMTITSKANGGLTTLGLINCVNVRDDALVRVIAQNPLIHKLHIPNCSGLTPEGVIEAVKTMKGRLVSLKIKGIPNISKEHVETLLSLLSVDQTDQQMKPNLYHEYKQRQLTLRGDDEETSTTQAGSSLIIDVEICPRCKKGDVIFDCPRLTCNRRRRRSPMPLLFNRWRHCRGCYGCIPRCEDCGNCVEFGEMCQVACGDIVCNICWLQLPKCQLCNKAYCKQHTDDGQYCSLPGSSGTGFVCHSDTCHANTQH